MKRMNSLSTGIFLLVVLAIPVTTYANYDESDAKYDCKRAIKSDGRYSHFADMHIEDKGHHSYLVTGKARSERDDRKHSFDCQVRHREVTSWHVDPVKTVSSHDGGSNTAAAVGAGLLGIAIMAAIASQDDDKNHNSKRDSYNRGAGGDPFDDMHYLRKECKRELRSHLDHDHGKVRNLKFTYVDLHHRKLRGDGKVSFKSGGDRELSFSCEFDRRGHIHDGHYHYRRQQDD